MPHVIFFLVAAFLVQLSSARATAEPAQKPEITQVPTADASAPARVIGEGRLVGREETKRILDRYGSIPGKTVVGEGRLISTGEASELLRRYKSIPGGFVLEDKGAGLDWVRAARYAPAANAIIINNQTIYALPISGRSVAVLARALARDDRIGASLGEVMEIVYGALPNNADPAIDLKLADYFLGDIALPPPDWTQGYRFAGGYEPRSTSGQGRAAVFFRFRAFDFALADNRVRLANAAFDVRIVPLLAKPAADGGNLPDFDAIAAGGVFEEYVTNARHIGENIDYYLREKIVDRILAYGEAVAFLRAAKDGNVNLGALAREIETSIGRSSLKNQAQGQLEGQWLAYLREIQALDHFPNWTAPPADLFLKRKATIGARHSSWTGYR